MMNTRILSNNSIALAIVIGAFAFAVLIANAASIFDIEYPIAELGNCEDRKACKAYCDDPSHSDECEAFAAKFGIGGQKSELKSKRSELIMADGGPGGCAKGAGNPEKACHSYCNKSANIKECVAYAKKNGIMQGKDLEEAEKVAKALESGATLPAGCENGEDCKKVCEEAEDVSVARQCFEFAEKAGLLPPDVNREQAEKMFKTLSSGKGPFKSLKELKQCDNPKDDATFEKCVAFGLENGMIPPEEVEMIKKTGGKGPGGCRGREQCDTYCQNNPEECQAFAEQHGLIREEDKARMKEGLERFREGLRNAPPEVSECLKTELGEEKMNSLFAGDRMPSRDIGEKMRTCFESTARRGGFGPGQFGGPDGQGPREGFGDGQEPGVSAWPPELKNCLVSKFGEEFVKGIENNDGPPSKEMEDKMRVCFEEQFGKERERGEPQGDGSFTGPGGCKSEEECHAYCEKNSAECGGAPGENNPEERMEGFRGVPEGRDGGRVPPERRSYEETRSRIYNEAYREEFMKREEGIRGEMMKRPGSVRPREGQNRFPGANIPGGPNEEQYRRFMNEKGMPPGQQFRPDTQAPQFNERRPADGMMPPQTGEFRQPPPGFEGGNFTPPPDGTPANQFMPPPGAEGAFTPPPVGVPEGQFAPPPDATGVPPPPDSNTAPAPTSRIQGSNFIGSIISGVKALLR